MELLITELRAEKAQRHCGAGNSSVRITRRHFSRLASGTRFFQGHLAHDAALPATKNEEGIAISWARFDDNYDSNEKILNAGRDAKDLHEVSIRWSCRLRTNGRVPKAALTELAILAQLPGRRSIHRNGADRLVELNLWEDDGDAWNIHDFEEFGPPKRFIDHAPRGVNHDGRGKYHAPRDPVPVPVPDPLEDFSKEVTTGGEAA